MAIKRRIAPDADSHFRLCRCGCGGGAEYLELETGLWAVQCRGCGKRGRPDKVRHRVQVNWNGGERLG